MSLQLFEFFFFFYALRLRICLSSAFLWEGGLVSYVTIRSLHFLNNYGLSFLAPHSAEIAT